MSDLRTVLEKRKNAYVQLNDLNKRAKKEGRDLSADEKDQWNKLSADIDNLTEQKERLERQKELDAQFAEKVDRQKPTQKDTPKYRDVYTKWAQFGNAALSSEERSVIQKRGTDTQVTSTDDLGGYTVPEDFGAEIIKSLAQYSGMVEASRILRTATGAPLPYPTLDETSVKGSRLGEGSADTVSDMTFGQKTLNAHKYTSGVIKISRELVQDSAFNLDSEVLQVGTDRIGRILNEELTTGDGSSKPNGILNAASVGVTASATDAFTRDEIIDLIHSVDRAYRPNAAFMLNDSVLKEIKKLTVGSADDRPLWQPSIREGAPDQIEGFNYVVNNDMEDLSAVSNKIFAFGDWSRYYVRIAQDIVLARSTDRYVEEYVVGYFLFLRADGELMDTNAIKTMALAAS